MTAFVLGNICIASATNLVKEYEPDGTLVQTISLPGGPFDEIATQDIAFDSQLRLYLVIRTAVDTGLTFLGNGIYRFTNTGADDGWFVNVNDQGRNPWSITIDAQDHVFLNYIDENTLEEYDETGTFVTSWAPTSTIAGGRIASLDSINLYYTRSFALRRYNISTSTQESNLNTAEQPSGDVFIDSDGNIWTSSPFQSKVIKVSPAGTLLTTYDDADLSDIAEGFNLNYDESSFYTADASFPPLVREFSIASGLQVSSFTPAAAAHWIVVVRPPVPSSDIVLEPDPIVVNLIVPDVIVESLTTPAVDPVLINLVVPALATAFPDPIVVELRVPRLQHYVDPIVVELRVPALEVARVDPVLVNLVVPDHTLALLQGVQPIIINLIVPSLGIAFIYTSGILSFNGALSTQQILLARGYVFGSVIM